MQSHSRRELLKSAGLGAAALAGLSASGCFNEAKAAEADASNDPHTRRALNVVLIVADDQRHDTIGALGNPVIKTPGMDRLVRSGFAFTGARCMGSMNPAVCVPARAMLHSGRSLFRVPEDIGQFTTLGQTLRAAGYETFHAGKWHNGTPAFVRSFSAGGNIFFGGMHDDQYKMPIRAFDPAGKYPQKDVRIGDKFSSELFADAAIDFLSRQSAPRVRPFFCHLAFTSPHDPRTPPLPFKTMYDPAKMPLPANWLPRHPFDNGELSIRDEKLAPLPRTDADTRKQLCDYYGMISSQDQQVGRVLDALKAAGRLADTLVIYTGDHGLSIGSHGLFGKQSAYEEAQRIPLIFSGPGVPAGKTSSDLAYGFDIFPTIIDLIGMNIPADVEGNSLKGTISGHPSKARESTFGCYIKPARNHLATQHGISDGRWKLIRYNVEGRTTTQLFDLMNDPQEAKDLAGDVAASKHIGRLQEMLSAAQKAWEEPEALRG